MSLTPLRELLRTVKADPEGCPVYETDLTRQEVRKLLDNPGAAEGWHITDQLDEAQASLQDDEGVAFLVIRIRP